MPPRVFITDGDENIERAFDIMKGNGLWVGCLHHLCVFHISKNVYKHVRPVFGNNVSGFTSVQDKFWKIAKNSDVGSILQFDEEWEELILLVTDEVHDSEEDQVTRAIHWIKVELYNKRHKWAARYVSQHPTCGMLSSLPMKVRILVDQSFWIGGQLQVGPHHTDMSKDCDTPRRKQHPLQKWNNT